MVRRSRAQTLPASSRARATSSVSSRRSRRITPAASSKQAAHRGRVRSRRGRRRPSGRGRGCGQAARPRGGGIRTRLDGAHQPRITASVCPECCAEWRKSARSTAPCCVRGEARKLSEISKQTREVYRDPATLARKERSQLIHGPTELLKAILDEGAKGQQMQRYKGLGEMNPDQLWETTLDPDARTLLQVKINDLAEADDIFTKLMGRRGRTPPGVHPGQRAERREPRFLSPRVLCGAGLVPPPPAIAARGATGPAPVRSPRQLNRVNSTVSAQPWGAAGHADRCGPWRALRRRMARSATLANEAPPSTGHRPCRSASSRRAAV